MALTAAELIELRAVIGKGTPPTDADLNTKFDRLGSVTLVAREVLSERLADLLTKPTSFSIPGEYSESRGGQIKALQEQLVALGGGVLSGTRIATLERDDPGR